MKEYWYKCPKCGKERKTNQCKPWCSDMCSRMEYMSPQPKEREKNENGKL